MSVTVRCCSETMSSTSTVNKLVKSDKVLNGQDEDREKDKAVRRLDKETTSQPSMTAPAVLRLVEIFVAETVGTGMLMFFGCMGQVYWAKDTPLPPFQGAVVFAVVVATVIQIFGHISAAHLNPAVTLCFLLLGQITPLASVVYVVAECFGAILGFGLLQWITPCDIWDITAKSASDNMCSTVPDPSLTDAQAIAAEFLATSCLILVVCGVTDHRNANQGSANSLKFAATIFAMSLTVGPYTGASMNPARSLGPALWQGKWHKHWIYWIAPMIAAFVTTIFYQTMFIRSTPSSPGHAEDLPLTGVQVHTAKDAKERK